MKNKLRAVAIRINRFKKADHWTQRRVKEGLAIHCACFAENCRAVEDLVPVWFKLKIAMMKEFEPVVLWCLRKAKAVVNEVKDAFPFFWCRRIGGIVHTPFEMANRILKITRTVYLSGKIRQVRCNIKFKINQ